MRRLVAVLAVLVAALALESAQSSGSSGGTSSGSSSSSGDGTSGSSGSSSSGDGTSGSSGSSGNGSSGSSGSSSGDGGSSGGGGTGDEVTPVEDDGTSGGSSGGSSGAGGGGTTDPDGGGSSSTTAPTSDTIPAPPTGYPTPEPDDDGNVTVPDGPPERLQGKSPRVRLSELPPIPRGCLDDDLTLLDIFLPAASIPLRFTYCLLYIGTIARVPSEISINVTTRTADGNDVNVGLVDPPVRQRPIATIALVLLAIAAAVLLGYYLGQRKRRTE